MEQYRLPKDVREKEEEKLEQSAYTSNKNNNSIHIKPGHAYESQKERNMIVDNGFDVTKGVNVWANESTNNKKNLELKRNRHMIHPDESEVDEGKADNSRRHKEHKHKSHKSKKDNVDKHKHTSSSSSYKESDDRQEKDSMELNNSTNANPIPTPMIIPNKPVIPATIASNFNWRGRRDPTVIQALATVSSNPYNRDYDGDQKKKEVNTVGGMDRRR